MLLFYSVLAVFAIIWLLSLFISLYAPSPRPLPSDYGSGKGSKKSVLLVIAHPDDESMFFNPTLLSLAFLGDYHVRLLCLSNGNAGGIGAIRKQEILSACSFLKVPKENLEVIDDASLQDGHNVIWSHDLIAEILKKMFSSYAWDIIITFDDYGVSGHPNHSAVYRGVCAFLLNFGRDLQNQKRPTIEAWKLESVNILKKYSGPVNVLYSMVEMIIGTEDQSHCFYNRGPQHSIAAMKQHATQWLWYRQLFVIFSFYTYMNRLQKIRF